VSEAAMRESGSGLLRPYNSEAIEGSLLFLGPTGVGKTQLTLEFARYLFGPEKVHRFDMSEFLHLDSVKLFMGEETGNVGRLGRVLSQHRRSVLLFDEIENHTASYGISCSRCSILRASRSLRVASMKKDTGD
jgi:ATP-dependent Clp protease ATP-binding subunit ClpA